MTEEQSIQPPAKPERLPRINMLRQLLHVLTVGVVLATLFTAWTPLGLIPTEWADRIAQGLLSRVDNPEDEPLVFLSITPTPRPKPRIGIVAGHWGNDSGAVCPDGLTEAEVNLEIASLVQKLLVSDGFDVDLLKEFDDRLEQYHALALVSIHADSCDFVSTDATGFKITSALGSTRPRNSERLVACIQSRYQNATGMEFHAGSITRDMTSYHAFDEIHNETAAAIIETGFMNLDRQILTQQPDLIARGIADGVLCYIYNESISTQPTPPPTTEP
jgi:N-acetylmuramoyl-L-alanine amidase